MSTETIFRLLAFLFLFGGFAISGYFRNQADKKGGNLGSEGQYLLILLRLLALVVIIPLILYLIQPEWVIWARLELPLWMRWGATAVCLLMLPCFYWLFSSIQNNISPTQATRQGHQLVTQGPYRWIRHPLYTFGLIFYLALSLMTGLWTIPVGMILPMGILFSRTNKEEANLIDQFGDEYRQYMARTGRYFPKFNS